MTSTQLETQPVQTQPATSVQPKGDALATLRPLILDLGIPLGSYYILRAAGVGLVPSLILSSVLPAARSIVGLIKQRTVNPLALLIVAVNMVSIGISFWSGDPRVMLAKDGAITSTIGIAILISAYTGRPLMTEGMRPFLVKGDSAKNAAFDLLLSTSPRFRTLERRFSLVWGSALLAECIVRVFCAFTLPVGTMVWLSTVLTLGAIGIGIVGGGFFSVPMETMVKAEAGK
jgi:hypothetical protein